MRLEIFNVPSCRHCGARPQLPPEVSGRLESLRGEIERSSKKAQQLDGQLASFGRGLGTLELVMGAMLWLFIGGIIVATVASSMPDEYTFLQVLMKPAAQIDAAATFWLTFLCVCGYGVALVFGGIARFFGRGQVRFAYPLAPPAPGEPPGCRVCGAALAAEGAAVRRCQFCSSDNLVDGVHFQQIKGSLVAEVDARKHAVTTTLEKRQQTVRRLEKLTYGPPFSMLVFMPVVLFFSEPQVHYWWIAAGIYLFAFFWFGLAALRGDSRAVATKKSA